MRYGFYFSGNLVSFGWNIKPLTRTFFLEKQIVCVGTLFLCLRSQQHVMQSNMCTIYKKNLHPHTYSCSCIRRKKVSPYSASRVWNGHLQAKWDAYEMIQANRLNASSSYFTAFVCVFSRQDLFAFITYARTQAYTYSRWKGLRTHHYHVCLFLVARTNFISTQKCGHFLYPVENTP